MLKALWGFFSYIDVVRRLLGSQGICANFQITTVYRKVKLSSNWFRCRVTARAFVRSVCRIEEMASQLLKPVEPKLEETKNPQENKKI